MPTSQTQWVRSRSALVRLLRERGLKCSAQRLGIAEILLSRPQHLCAEEILGRARRRGLRVSRATVYNTLKRFVELGLARELRLNRGGSFYDSCTHEHYHVYNEDTGQLSDLQACPPALRQLPALPPDTVLVGVDVVVHVRGARQGVVASGAGRARARCR